MRIPILMYHQIGEPNPKGTPFRLTVHPSDFTRQMRWMRRLGYRGLSMRDVMPYVRGERQGKVFGITFDDGFRNVFENVTPVLSELGFTATNYFVSHQFDGGNVWDKHVGIPHAPLMSVSEMRAWAQAGNEVGSHTLDHVHLPALPPDEARRQIVQSGRTRTGAGRAGHGLLLSVWRAAAGTPRHGARGRLRQRHADRARPRRRR